MSTSVTVGTKDLTPHELARRAHLGPQTILLDGHAFELCSPIHRPGNNDAGYLAIRPHSATLYVVEPFLNRYWAVDPREWSNAESALISNRIPVDRLTQYLAELDGDEDVLRAAARTLVESIRVTGFATVIGLGEHVCELLKLHKPEDWAQLGDAIEPPDMIPPADEVEVNSNALVALATHLRAQFLL